MNILIPLMVSVVLFVVAGRYYPRYLGRVFGERDEQPTPAVRYNDGRDYVPTRTTVVFAHHFASIAGAGPILGPIVALIYGYAPVWVWVVFGGILFGAVHDFAALFASIRQEGRSIAEVARRSMGNLAFALFISFTILMLILVTSAFLNLAALSLTSTWPLDKLGLEPTQTILRTVSKNGVTYGKIGGIASTSVIFITFLAPLIGFLVNKRQLHVGLAHVLALVVCVVGIYIGFQLPVQVDSPTWKFVIAGYTLVAAGIPVWLLLQPRDFVNVQVLYGGIVFLFVALFVGGLQGVRLGLPAVNIVQGGQLYGAIWPLMFITVACGAISGFHSLVASGTTAKQVRSERDAKRIGYWGMLLESLLAVLVILTVASTLSFKDYLTIVHPKGAAGNWILAFAVAMGQVINRALPFVSLTLATVMGILVVEGFVVTTLDTAVRMNRYLFEELWNILLKGKVPLLMRSFWFNSGVSVALMLLFALTNAVGVIWTIFGAANQLVAMLALLTVSAWLFKQGKKFHFTLLPAIFMMVTTLTALWLLLKKYYATHNYLLLVTDALLFVLAIAIIVIVIKVFSTKRAPELATVQANPGETERSSR
jgi:carbon starvation protein